MSRKLNIVTIYTSEDNDVLLSLLHHLNPLNDDFKVSIWHDDPIDLGQQSTPQFESRLHQADIFLLLISDAFMRSEFIKQHAFKSIIDRHKENEAVVIPIIIEPCEWNSDFKFDDYNFNLNELQVLPKEGSPIVDWNSPDQAYNNVATGVRSVLTSFVNHIKSNESKEAIENKTANDKREDQLAMGIKEEIDAEEEENRLWEEREAKRRAEAAKRIREEAEASAKRREEEEQRLMEETEARRKAESEKRILEETAASTRRREEEEQRRMEESEARSKAESEKKILEDAAASARKRDEKEQRRMEKAEARRKAEAEKMKGEEAETLARQSVEEENRLRKEQETKRIIEEENQLMEAAAASTKRSDEAKQRRMEEAEAGTKVEGEKRILEAVEKSTNRSAEEENRLKNEEEAETNTEEEKKIIEAVEVTTVPRAEEELRRKEKVETKPIDEEEYPINLADEANDYVEETQLGKNANVKKRVVIGSLVGLLAIVGIWTFSVFNTGPEKQSPILPKIKTPELKDSVGLDKTKVDSLNKVATFSKLVVGDTFDGGIIFTIDHTSKSGKMAYPKDVGPMSWNDAMNIQEQLGAGWRLPTFDELEIMYRTIGQGAANSGQFADELYWSATLYDENQARLIRFRDGNTSYHYNKSLAQRKFHVRAVRDFSQ